MTTRTTIFALLSMCIMFGWVSYIERQERTRLAKVKAARIEAADAEAKKKAEELAKEPKKPDAKGKDAPKDPAKGDQKAPPTKEADKGKKPDAAAVKPAPPAAQVPLQTLLLGDNVDDGAYRIFAKISTRGAVVTELDLPAYTAGSLRSRFTLLNRGASYSLKVDGEDLGSKTWEYVAKESNAPTLAVFKTTAKEGAVEVVKAFSLAPDSYMVGLKISFRNLSGKPIDDLSYELEGGQNLPIEGLQYTTYFRHTATCIIPKSGATYLDEQLNAAIAQDPNGRGQPLEANPIRFAGTSIQYFASVVIQEPDPRVQRLIQTAQPEVRPPFEIPVAAGAAKKPEPNHANIGVVVKSQPIRLESAATVTHDYSLFNGPKRKTLLEKAEYAAHDLDKLIVYQGFFGLRFDSISNFMAWFLHKLYTVVGDYGVAIILLTVCVRLCLFPISFRQAKSMQKMQLKMAVIQPKMEELKRTYANDRDKLNREMMELYRKHDMNPVAQMAGCLPVFLQMPIFVGLYQALQGFFDLRNAPFHFTWIHDLAAPDQLLAFPGPLPWLGTHFNLLPLISLAQILLQMHYMTPPATTPEMQEQQKQTQFMMRIMMIFMFFTFYKVPAGLCVYIIVSGAWAMLERQFLPKPPKPAVVAASASTAASTNGSVAHEAKWKVPLNKDKKKKGK